MRADTDDGTPLATAGALLLAAAVGVADLLAPISVNPAVLHPAVVALAGLGNIRRWIWPLVALLAALGYLPLVLWGGGADATLWANRTLALLTTVLVASVVQRWARDRDAFVQVRRDAERHAANLEASNAELAAREEEIARQNEELQSQTEELERQGEELRIANEELATRERMLAQLLDVARTLSSEIHRPDVMATICEAVTEILDESPTASAMLVRQGDVLTVRCHHGFGPAGPATAELAYEQSFAALVIGRGQTAFLADLAMRPDLRVLEPASTSPFRSVLAAPIWLRGQAVGTLEVYNTEPRQWTEEQVALLTSMSAQASISLETHLLFEELDREKRRFEAVFRALPVGVLVCNDPECRTVMGNPAAAALFNTAIDANYSPFASPAAMVRRTILRNGEEVAAEELPLVRAVKRGMEVRSDEVELVLPNGHRYTIVESAVPIYDAAGRLAGGVSVIVDVSSRKRLERELELRRREAEEASVRKTRFLSAMSHDIRTPANAIRLRAELIKRTATDPALASRVPQLVEDLQASAIAMVELVGEVLDLTRFDTGRVELHETEFSLGEMLSEECTHLRPVADAKGLLLTCAPIEPPLVLRTDRVKLGRVIGNLLDNAIKFTAAGEVGASARLLPDRRVEISVRDTGPGIPAEHLEHVFDEFFQLRNPERDRNKGRGLGLAISKRLVDALGGELRAAVNPEGGSTFTVWLGAASVVPYSGNVRTLRAVPPAVSPKALAGLRVLVVEDHDSTRGDVVALLRGEGAIVSHARNGTSALRLVRDTAPEILLLDLMLPDIDGAEVLRRLRNERPETLRSILVLTGDSALRPLEELERLGADAVIPKPIDPTALLERLRALRTPPS